MKSKFLMRRARSRIKFGAKLTSIALCVSLAITSAFTTQAIAKPMITQVSVASEGETQFNSVRLQGNDRYQTAIAISKQMYPQGTDDILLARGDNFPDALSGVPLAHKLKAPLLLTNSNRLTEDTKQEIKRLNAKKVYLLGGTEAISEEIEDTLREQGLEVRRLGGLNRYETAQMIAKELGTSSKAVITNGKDFPDALSVSSWAANNGIPILLSDPSKLPEATLKALQDSQVTSTYIIGGIGAISENVEQILKQANMNPTRIWGNDRYETAVKVAQSLKTKNDSLFIATGSDFPDALAGAVMAAQNSSTLLLVNSNISPATVSYLESIEKVDEVFALGGPGAVSDEVLNSIKNILDEHAVTKPSSSGGGNGGGGASTPVETQPVISITEQSGEVLTPLLNVTGTVKDTRGLSKVSYSLTNDKNQTEMYQDLFTKTDNSQTEVKDFNLDLKDLELESGVNHLKILAINIKGLQAQSQIDIAYKAPTMKQLNEQKIATDTITGMMYVTDQILITGKEGVTEEEIVQLIQPYNGLIVGSIPITNDYQVEIQGDVTKVLLDNIILQLKENEFVEAVSLNKVSETPVNIVIPNDSHWGSSGDWSVTAPEGSNWGVEAIKAPAAWEYNSEMQRINVGLIDSMFDTSHQDLAFTRAFNNPVNLSEYEGEYEEGTISHGTHVAGTIAATSNNEKGIAGLVWNSRLYGFSIMNHRSQSLAQMSSIMDWKYALAELIMRNVKVINVSMGMTNMAQVAALNGNQDILRVLDEQAEQFSVFIKKLLNKGFDFVIVQAAGNASNLEYVADESTDFGYRRPGDQDTNKQNTNWIDATFSGFFTGISDLQVKNRIIVVGAIKNEGYTFDWFGLTERIFKGYSISKFSQVGSRVDVVAPGEEISSTIPNNSYGDHWEGTSMAAPHVTGVAGMVWAINPQLTGEQVKNIVVQTADRPITLNGINYPILNAQAAVERARSEEPNESPVHEDTGILMGSVASAENRGKISNAQISVYKQYGQGGTATTAYTASTVTNDEGEFELLLPGGQYSLNIIAPGYLPFQMNINVLNNTTTYTETILTIADVGGSNQIGKAGGLIKDAFTGYVIPNVDLKFRSGWNSTSGDYIENDDSEDIQLTTNDGGYYEANLRKGNYTVEASKEGYVTGYFNIVVLAANPNLYQHGILTPILPEGQTRIVLSWGQNPGDLDSHLTGPTISGDRFHIFFASKTYSDESNTKQADLDVDDTSSYGPETTTIYQQIPGVYRFSIHDYSNRNSSNSMAMSLSGAQVKVYRGNSIVSTFNVPNNQVGTVWTVFEINENDEIIPINTMTNESDPNGVSRLNLRSIVNTDSGAEDSSIFKNLPPKVVNE